MTGHLDSSATAGDVTLTSSPAAPDTGNSTGTIIGRYVVISQLGAGSMGVVLAAYDPELDRKVAIKLLRARAPDEAARARLRREAQALAKLDHNNVVAVHDVGVHDDQLFVAMDFIAGQTLGAWMRAVEAPRPWREVVRVFAEAGRGLAAAHDAGLVHRDFKPDNVMVGDDGRVRVMDFGLARADDEEHVDTDAELRDSVLEITNNILVGPLTRTGALVGTPAYMAPEQFAGVLADARSDQFSFCVALYEALYGERPFAGRSIAQLVDSISRTRFREVPASATVPAWLRRVVLGGLSRAPQGRFESMHALLDALAKDPGVRRRRWVGGGAAVATLGLLASTWALVRAPQRDVQACPGMERKLAGVWDEPRRAAVLAAIESTNLSFAPHASRQVKQRLDEYTTRWVEARVEACEATHRGEQSGELLDLRMACLDERLRRVRATVGVLAQANETTVEKSVEAVMELPQLARCADIEALRSSLPPPEDPSVARSVTALDERLAQVEALELAGQYEAGMSVAIAITSEADQLGYAPLQARAWLRKGISARKAGNYEAAEEALELAYEFALAQGMLDEAARASTNLVLVVGYGLARHDEGRRWAQDSGPLSQATRSREVRAHHFNSLGLLAEQEGRFEEAHAHHQRALAIYEEVLGPKHPEVATSVTNLGNVVGSQGQYEEARAHHQRALAIYEETLGPEHPNVALALNNLGNVTLSLGEYGQTRVHFERALAIWEGAFGSEHLSVATPLVNLGIVAAKRGEFAEAREQLERAREIFVATLGPEHPNVAIVLANLGDIAKREGKLEEARGLHEQALAMFEGALGVDHPTLAYPLTSLGEVLLDQGAPAAALPHLERALALRGAAESAPSELAETLVALARALWDAPAASGRDRPRARALAQSARDAYTEQGTLGLEELEELEAWLAGHVE